MKDRTQARAHIPYEVQYTVKGDRMSQEGELCDISITGCRLASKVEIPPVGAQLELCIHPEDGAIPLIIDKATVQWVKEDEFGVVFSEIRPDTKKRIKEICRQLTW